MVIDIIRLMLSLLVWPKVISLSSFYCSMFFYVFHEACSIFHIENLQIENLSKVSCHFQLFNAWIFYTWKEIVISEMHPSALRV